MTKKDTKLTESGRHPKAHAGAVNVPVFRASTILFPNVAALTDSTQPYSYGRRGTPSSHALEEAIAALEGVAVGGRTMLTPSGLSACALAILGVCSVGDHLLVSDSCYGPTRLFCTRVAQRFGIETEFFPPLVGAEVAEKFRPNTKAVFLESPGSYTFEVEDVPAIAVAAHASDIAVLLDNTWATPLYFDAFAHGVDISIQAATKYLGGHADASVGAITAAPAYAERLADLHGTMGITIGGDDAYLILRGLRTLAVRLARHQETALALARWLGQQRAVARVLHPALESDPGHTLWQRDFTGASGLFGVELAPASDRAVAAMIDGLTHFGIGYSWGGYESLILPAHFSRRFKTFHQTGPLIRLHAGLEDLKDLQTDLAAGLERLAKEA